MTIINSLMITCRHLLNGSMEISRNAVQNYIMYGVKQQKSTYCRSPTCKKIMMIGKSQKEIYFDIVLFLLLSVLVCFILNNKTMYKRKLFYNYCKLNVKFLIKNLLKYTTIYTLFRRLPLPKMHFWGWQHRNRGRTTEP